MNDFNSFIYIYIIILKLVSFEVPNVEEMFGILFLKACFGDGGEHFLEMMLVLCSF
jgi:hypothetical protein